MNERIKELLEQSGLQPYYDAQEGQIEKFAELIVKECAKFAVEAAEAAEIKMMDNFVIEFWIKKHFGVEE